MLLTKKLFFSLLKTQCSVEITNVGDKLSLHNPNPFLTDEMPFKLYFLCLRTGWCDNKTLQTDYTLMAVPDVGALFMSLKISILHVAVC